MRNYINFPNRIKKNIYYLLIIAFIFIFLFAFQISIYYPIYSDEFEWKLISSRFFLDQKKSLYLFPACINSYFTDTPLSSYLGRIFDSMIYEGAQSKKLLRNLGLVQFFILIVLYWQIFAIHLKFYSIKSLVFILGFFSIGLMPILMVLNRPELPLLVYVSMCVYLSVLSAHKNIRLLKNNAFVTLIFCLLSSLIITTHPKGIYLIPIIFITYRQIIKSNAFLIILLGIIFWTLYETVQFWSLRTSCSESPWIENLVKSFSLNPGQIFTEPGQFFLQLIKNCIRFYAYIEPILFSTKYQSQWLPAIHISKFMQYLLWLINTFSLFLVIGIFGLIFIRSFKIKEIKYNSHKKIGAAIAFSLLIITVMQTAKNFYESTLIFPLLLLLFIFFVNPADVRIRKYIFSVALPALLVIGSLSNITRYFLFSDHLSEWKSSLNEVVYDKMRLEDFVSNQCGISVVDNGLIVDRKTYPVFGEHNRPIFISALIGWYGTGTDYKRTLKLQGAGGVIAMCSGLPSEMRDLSHEDAGICCVSKDNILQLIKQ